MQAPAGRPDLGRAGTAPHRPGWFCGPPAGPGGWAIRGGRFRLPSPFVNASGSLRTLLLSIFSGFLPGPAVTLREPFEAAECGKVCVTSLRLIYFSLFILPAAGRLVTARSTKAGRGARAGPPSRSRGRPGQSCAHARGGGHAPS